MKSLGQIAYEAAAEQRVANLGGADDATPWAELNGHTRSSWQAAADAVARQADLSPVTGQARRYFDAVYGPDWVYKAPEQFPNVTEQWVWALAAGDTDLAEAAMAKLESGLSASRTAVSKSDG